MQIKLIIAAIIILIIGFIFLQKFFPESYDLPSGETVIEETGDVKNNDVKNNKEVMTQKEIMVTDGVKHTIPLNKIIKGCPSKDCIPSIDNPTFESINEAEGWLDDEAPGIAFSQGNINRFYPYDILVSHEIVNDTVDGRRVLISYCPLCLTAVIYDPLVEGERVEFGVSGLLWESNLIMYDRKTDTLWSQILGEAVLGKLTGTKLELLNSDQLLFGKWKKAFPQGEVLAKKFLRGSGGNPYAKTHFDISSTALYFAEPTDTRLPYDAHVFGVVVNGKPKAYNIETVKQKGIVQDVFEGKTIELVYDEDLGAVRIFEILPDGNKKRINPLSGFWFSWAETYPETELYK